MTPEELVAKEALKKERLDRIEKRNTNQMYGDLAASLGPSVLAILGGASPAVTTSLLDKGNQYAMNRGKQEEITKDKLVEVENEMGDPENVLARDAVGMKPYERPLLGRGGAGANGTTVHNKLQFTNKKTGELRYAYMNKDGKSYWLGETPDTGAQPLDANILNEYIPFAGYGTVTNKDMYDNITVQQYPKANPQQKTTVGGSQGYAGLVGVPQKGLEEANKAQDDFDKVVVPIRQKISNLDGNIGILRGSSSTPTQKTAAREAIIRGVISDPILTDSDVARSMGEDYRALIDSFKNTFSKKIGGKMSDAEQEDMLKAYATIKSNLERGIITRYGSMKDRLSTVPGAAPVVSERNKETEKMINQKKAQLESIKQVAKRRFGDNKKLYDAYINQKKLEMGIE